MLKTRRAGASRKMVFEERTRRTTNSQTALEKIVKIFPQEVEKVDLTAEETTKELQKAILHQRMIKEKVAKWVSEVVVELVEVQLVEEEVDSIGDLEAEAERETSIGEVVVTDHLSSLRTREMAVDHLTGETLLTLMREKSLMRKNLSGKNPALMLKNPSLALRRAKEKRARMLKSKPKSPSK